MPRYLGRDRLAIAAAVVAPLAVSAMLLPVRGSLSRADVVLILVLVIVAVAANGHRLAGALAALSAAVWFDFFFTQPQHSFAITNAADVRSAVLLLMIGLGVSQLAARARRLRMIAVTDAGYLTRLHDTAELTQTSRSPGTVVDHVKRELTELLDLRDCRFEYGSLLGHPARLEQDGAVVVGHRHWDVDRRGLPDQDIELRTFGNGHFYGRFMLRPTPGTIPSLQARLVAVTLADQVGRTLETQENG
jgi:hypothetical protein